MATTAEQMRAWTGPALFSFGFRPFFLGGAFWAALAMVLWIAALSGWDWGLAMDPVSWHAHAFLFGYLGAVVAGFMMTAVPNWTGRMPIVGWPLAGLFGLWLIGRLAVLASGALPSWLVALLDLAFPVTLAVAMAREIVAGRNWRNLVMVALLCAFIIANALFHWEVAQGGYAAHGTGVRLGLAAAIMMIALIGGRIVPSFTRNWLAQRGATALPTPPGRRFDKAALLGLAAAVVAWTFWPDAPVVGIALVLMGGLHLQRLIRWRGLDTGAEPLVWVLHVAYAFVPLGALALGTELLLPGVIGQAPAQHLWMAGAVGLMTLAVMSRATLGHTGRALTAGSGTVVLYLCLIGSVIARLLAGSWIGAAHPLHIVSGLLWVGAFGGYAALYGPLLLRPRKG